MTIIGAMGNVNFLKYLVRSVSLQSGPALHGRIQLFAIIKAKDYAVLTATPENHVRSYSCWTVLFNLFFDYELLEEFPRKFFLPLDPHRKRNVFSVSYDPDKVYFMRINLKQELPVPTDQLLPLYFFVRQFFVSGLSRVIPTIEKWVPDSGLSVLVPKMKHIDYYENMGIFTTFKELKAHQILHVFNEMVNNPAYQGSPFTDMVENELIKSETIETNMADANLGKTLHDDIEEKLDKR
nr:unnamed protein product [Callosobruchus chinensis]